MQNNLHFDYNNLMKININEITFLPRHKYSFKYNGHNYIGFFRKTIEENDKRIHIFNNFSIEFNINEPRYIFHLKHYKLSPTVARLLEQDRFSDSDSDGFDSDISPNYINVTQNEIKDEIDGYVNIQIFTPLDI